MTRASPKNRLTGPFPRRTLLLNSGILQTIRMETQRDGCQTGTHHKDQTVYIYRIYSKITFNDVPFVGLCGGPEVLQVLLLLHTKQLAFAEYASAPDTQLQQSTLPQLNPIDL